MSSAPDVELPTQASAAAATPTAAATTTTTGVEVIPPPSDNTRSGKSRRGGCMSTFTWARRCFACCCPFARHLGRSCCASTDLHPDHSGDISFEDETIIQKQDASPVTNYIVYRRSLLVSALSLVVFKVVVDSSGDVHRYRQTPRLDLP